MIDQTLPQPPVPNTPELLKARAGRALDLYRERRHDIEDLGEGLYLIPSSDGENFDGVNYVMETCSCPDAARHPELTCKHVFLIWILNAKRRTKYIHVMFAGLEPMIESTARDCRL